MHNKNKISRYIYFCLKLIVFLTILFPITISIFFTIKYGFPPWSSFNWILLIIISTIFLISFYFLYLFLFNIKEEKKTVHVFYPLIIFLFAFLIRVISVKTIGINYGQVSDFNIAYNSGINNNFRTEMYAKNSHWAFYPQIIYFVTLISNNKNTETIQYFNCLIISFSCVFLYFICQKITKNNKISFITGLIFASYLPNIIYINILTPEHPAVFFISFGFLFYIFSFYQKKTKVKILTLIISCLLFAISSFFRPFSHILILAIVLIEIVKLINTKEKIKSFISISLIIIFYLLFVELGFQYLRLLIGEKINRSFLATTVYIGLNSKCFGNWCPEVIKEIDTLTRSNENDYEESSKILKEKIIEDIKTNYSLLPVIIYKKSITTWAGDNHSIGWILAGENKKDKNINENIFLTNTIQPLLSINYLLIMIFVFISNIYNLFKKNKIEYISLILNLFLLGTSFLFIITESQPRYKSVIIPFIILLSTLKNPLLKKLNKN